MINFSIEIPLEKFRESYEWCKNEFGIPQNMLFKTGYTESSWDVKRVTNGHIFIFENENDFTKVKEHIKILKINLE